MRARGFRFRACNFALARLAWCRERGGLPTRAPRLDDSRQVSGLAPPGQEFARYAGYGHARNVAGPSKDAVAVVVGEGFDPGAVEEGCGADAVALGVSEGEVAHGTGACVVGRLESAQDAPEQAPNLAVV